MHFTKDAHHLFRSQTDHTVTTRMPPLRGTAHDLNFGRRTDRRQNRLSIRLGVIHIHIAGRAMHILGTRTANQ